MPTGAHLAMRRGVFPGSFNPPTTAHLAISQAAVAQHQLDELVWSVSRVALAKEDITLPRFEHRLAVLEQVAQGVSWLRVEPTGHQLLSDIAAGFDVIVMGADKWNQIHDLRFYGNNPAARDQSIAALPNVAIAARGDHDFPPELALALPPEHEQASSTAARAGQQYLMLEAARQFDQQTGAWSDPERYLAWSEANR